MGRNVEIKARIDDVDSISRRAAALSGSLGERIDQQDTFFPSKEGRLKVRAFADGSGQLIFYERPDVRGPKTSRFSLVPTSDAASLCRVLGQALGVRAVVSKVRHLYLVGQTRVHIDRVEGLGDFLELEVVLDEGQTESEGAAIAAQLMERLGVDEAQLVHGAYVDLIESAREFGAQLDNTPASGKL